MAASSSVLPRGAKSSLVVAVQLLRRSQSLASMLPSVLLTGAITLVVTAVMRLTWAGFSHDFFQIWMESWLISWPIAFPVAYLAGPFLVKLAARISAPARTTAQFEPVGLALGDIERASRRATVKNGLEVRRGPKGKTDTA